MDRIVHDVRRQEWIGVIQSWSASGQTKKSWCRENGISERKFFYWQKRLREELYEQATAGTCEALVPAGGEEIRTTFAELPTTSQSLAGNTCFQADAVIRAGVLTIEISNSASKNLLDCLGRTIQNAVQRKRL